jgi:Mn-containing catalase
MAKAIKSFTVDKETYDSLINKLKDKNVETSISFLLNKYLKELLDYIEAVEEELKKWKEYTVPVSFIINSLKDLPNFDAFRQQGETERRKLLKENIDKWQKKFNEAQEEKTPLMLNPDEYKEYKAIEKEYGINDAIKFLFKVLSKQVKMRRELTDEEYKAEENAIGSGFRAYRKEKIVPKFDKIDKHLDKFFKEYEIRVIEKPSKK